VRVAAGDRHLRDHGAVAALHQPIVELALRADLQRHARRDHREGI
jgi:hypothetical protein